MVAIVFFALIYFFLFLFFTVPVWLFLGLIGVSTPFILAIAFIIYMILFVTLVAG